MSFSGGVFTINTSGQPVVAGTTISASVFNAFTADIATGLSTCMLKDGTQTATAGIGFFAGTVSLPGIYLGTDSATGLYRIGLNNPGFAINGTKLLDLSAALVGITGALTVSTTALVTGVTTLTGGARKASGTTASTATATPVTLFNVSSQVGAYLVNVCITGTDAAVYSATSLVTCTNDASVAKITSLTTGTNISLTLTGAGNVQATQTSGSNQVMTYTYFLFVA